MHQQFYGGQAQPLASFYTFFQPAVAGKNFSIIHCDNIGALKMVAQVFVAHGVKSAVTGAGQPRQHRTQPFMEITARWFDSKQ